MKNSDIKKQTGRKETHGAFSIIHLGVSTFIRMLTATEEKCGNKKESK